MSPRPRSGVVLGGGPAPSAPTNGQPAPAPRRSRSHAGGGLLANLGPVGYLWLLVALEVAAIAGLRRYFHDHHGG